MENLIKKLKVFFLIVICFVYLLFSCKFSHDKWLNGITKEETVMCKDSSVTVVDASGKTSTLKNVKVGDVVTIRGTMNNGAFVASVILIESK